MAVLTHMDCPRDDDFALWLELLNIPASPQLLDGLGDFLTTYLRECGLNLYVMGLSGGIDSSFLAALLFAYKIPYLGVCLPIDSNTPAEIERGLRVAESYACRPPRVNTAPVHDFTALYRQISTAFAPASPPSTPLAEGNLKARTRMLFLYHQAQLHGGCVLSTDQLDELLTGFWTLHGDVGDVSPIQLLPKSVEYELARQLCTRLDNPAPLQAAIDAVPTDGLGISVSDLDQLGVSSYVQVEELFRDYFQLRLKAQKAPLSPVDAQTCGHLEQQEPIRRFLRSTHKRRGPLIADPRSVVL